MTAATLLAAADRLDALAREATPGPWTCYGDHLVWPSEQGPAANDPVVGMVGEAHQDSAALIATMRGTVEPLASVLREMAKGACCDECMNDPAADPFRFLALTLARAVLAADPSP